MFHIQQRMKKRVEAKGLLCYWATSELNIPFSDLALKLAMTPSGVSYAARRGEAIVRENDFRLTAMSY